MKSVDEMRAKVDGAILGARDDILDFAARLAGTPETGFQEYKTAALLEGRLRSLGSSVEVEVGLARTGLRASAGPGSAPEIVLLADMDALPTRGAEGGVMHSCGHHAQMVAMMAAFEALCAARAPEKLGFRLSFVGAPAEEYTQIDFRKELRAKGEITYLSGKQELIRLGVFDGASAVLKYHSMADSPDRLATVNGTLNGFVAKQAIFIGKPAHSGAAPDQGINALNAASLALLAIHAQRETFRDDDHIRVHPVMKDSGTTVNTVPDRAQLETYVRGASIAAIRGAALKVDRALAAGALACGAELRIATTPGYQPFRPCSALGEALARSASRFIPADRIDMADRSYASDDIGDVATLVPACQLGFSGFSGTIHGADFLACDADRAYLTPARILADFAIELGEDGGARAAKVRRDFVPALSKADYLAYLDECFEEKTYNYKEWPCTER